MKTKLLRKVRKRFNVIRYDRISNRDNSVLSEIGANLGFPFYVIEYDNIYDLHYVATYPEIMDKLQKLIVKKYGHMFRKTRPDKYKKVWWTK